MTQELQLRNFEIRSINEETREVTGIAVPWDTDANIGSYTERFERGAVGDSVGKMLFWNHDHKEPIGLVTRGEDTDSGHEITARISDTPLGNTAYTLLKDKVVKSFSVGFYPKEHRTDEDGAVVRTKVDLFEVSLVPFPAYAGATISQVRSESTNASNLTKEVSTETIMENENVNNDSEIRGRIDVLERELAVVRENGVENAGTVSQYRSGGEFLKALLERETNAQNEIRAYTGAVLADSHTSNDWKSDLLVIVNKGRPLVNLFDRGPLGASGMTVEYPYVSAVTGDVAVQVNEGDDLAYIEIEVDTKSAPVKTYGGYSQLSRQAIERSDVSYLDAVLRQQAASYAKVTNAAVRTAMTAATPQTGSSFTLSSATAADFLGAVVDGVSKIDANGQGLQADFILVSTDVYAKMASVASTGFAFDANGSAGQTIGSVNVRGISGSLAGVPIVVDAGLANKSFYVASNAAVSTWENAGAPIRLQDENIVNLTKDFALYGYMAVGVKNANGLVKAQVA